MDISKERLEAIKNLHDIIEEKLRLSEEKEEQRSVNVVIAGPSCSGKSTMATYLESEFHKSRKVSVSVLPQDNYFKDLPDIPHSKAGYLVDSVNAFETMEYVRAVERLLKYGYADMPAYDIFHNVRLSEVKRIYKGAINIFEGLHTISLVGGVSNGVSVYLDTPIETCLERRIARDTVLHNVPEESVRRFWKDCVMPMYEAYILPQKKRADMIVGL